LLFKNSSYNRYLIAANISALAVVTTVTAQLQLQLSVSRTAVYLFIQKLEINVETKVIFIKKALKIEQEL